MMLLWACAGVPLGVYNIVSNFTIALQVQPQILTCLSLVTWMQCKYYGNKWSKRGTLVIAAAVGILLGGIECGLVFGLRKSREDRVQWPITLMAVLSAVLLCAGVLRHYLDIYQERTVRGISFLFVGLDALGDLTSLISVLFEPHIDVLGLVIYGSELVLWMGVMAAGGYYNLVPWIERRMSQPTSHPRDAVYQQSAASSSSTVFRTPSGSNYLREELPSTVRLRQRAASSQ